MVWNHRIIRNMEISSIRDFVNARSSNLTGRVLDYGAGKEGTCREPQPYRGYVRGKYEAYDIGDPDPIGKYDTILCTQVLQYIKDPLDLLKRFASYLNPGGTLLMTYPTNWDEVEVSDLWRFTKFGMEELLYQAGFSVVEHIRRAEVELGGFKFPLGYGVVAKEGGITKPHCVLDQDQSVELLTQHLKDKIPFSFWKFGDGALECIFKKGNGRTCDGEVYSDYLQKRLMHCWDAFIDGPNVFIGDWFTASFGARRETEYADEYRNLISNSMPFWLHFECLLMMRYSNALKDFWRAVKIDKRRKVLVGPHDLKSAALILGCAFIEVPMVGLLDHVIRVFNELVEGDYEVVLWAAGMAGHIPITDYWLHKDKNVTCISIGSGLDPAFRGKTRKVQVPKDVALSMLPR